MGTCTSPMCPGNLIPTLKNARAFDLHEEDFYLPPEDVRYILTLLSAGSRFAMSEEDAVAYRTRPGIHKKNASKKDATLACNAGGKGYAVRLLHW